MRSAFYQLMIVAVYVLAGWDLVRFSQTRMKINLPASDSSPVLLPGCEDSGWEKIWRLTIRISAAWLAFQLLAVAVLVLTGNWDRANTAAVFYLTNALALFVILPTGAYWQARIGTPVFPMITRASSGLLLTSRNLVVVLIAALLPLVISAVLFRVVSWQPDRAMAQRLEPAAHGGGSNLIFGAFLLLSAAVAEEVIWRHYFLVRLVAALRRWFSPGLAGCIAALATAFIFVCGHGAMIEPGWLKDVQILLYGLALALCQLRLGTEAAVAVHLTYNTAGILLFK